MRSEETFLTNDLQQNIGNHSSVAAVNLALSLLDAAQKIPKSWVSYLQELGSHPSHGFIQGQKEEAVPERDRLHPTSTQKTLPGMRAGNGPHLPEGRALCWVGSLRCTTLSNPVFAKLPKWLFKMQIGSPD